MEGWRPMRHPAIRGCEAALLLQFAARLLVPRLSSPCGFPSVGRGTLQVEWLRELAPRSFFSFLGTCQWDGSARSEEVIPGLGRCSKVAAVPPTMK
jgi:hypothetical protein